MPKTVKTQALHMPFKSYTKGMSYIKNFKQVLQNDHAVSTAIFIFQLAVSFGVIQPFCFIH